MLRVDRRLLLHLDWVLFALTALLLGLGLMTVWSLVPRLGLRQLLWFGVGGAAAIVILSIDYHTLARWAYVGYGAGIAALLAVLALGRAAQGARRWLSLGPITLQPSELFKLVLIEIGRAHV